MRMDKKIRIRQELEERSMSPRESLQTIEMTMRVRVWDKRKIEIVSRKDQRW